jgi:hypothetical protein
MLFFRKETELGSLSRMFFVIVLHAIFAAGCCFSRVYSLNENIAAANLFICCFPITSLQLM